ncbi:hypothetical protein GCM10027040_05110 [Halomonas shantousis]
MNAPFSPSVEGQQSTLACMKQARRWLLWKYGPPKPGKKSPKIPYYADGSPRQGELDNPDDQARLVSYGEAKEALSKGIYGGLGFALGPDGNDGFWQGIDYDHIPEHNGLQAIAEETKGYIEYSPSGTGVHAIGYGEEFDPLASNGSGIEAYSRKRFFTFTGNWAADQELVCLASFVREKLAPLRSSKAVSSNQATDAEGEVVSPETITDLRSALNYLDADNRDTWIAVGMALKTLKGGRGLWLTWSQYSDKFESNDAARTWETLEPSHTGWKAVFTKAQDAGWVNPNSNEARGQRSTSSYKSNLEGPLFDLLEPFGEFIQKQTPILKLVRGLLGEGCLSVLYGAPGAGKSFLALDLGFAIATGQPWMDRDTQQGPVIYACGEGVGGLRQRGRGIAQVKGQAASDFYFLPHAMSAPDETEELEKVLARVKDRHGRSPSLLIVDTLSRFFGSGDDENSAKDMKRFFDALGALIAKHPALHIMVVHHSGKTQESGMRGSSALQGAADTVIACKKNAKGLHDARVEKQKDGPENIILPFRLEPVDLGEDAGGERLTTCTVASDASGRPAPPPPLKGYAADAVEILRYLRNSKLEGQAGNLVDTNPVEIPLNAYRNRWYQQHPTMKEDSARKTMRRKLEELCNKQLIEWGGSEEPICILPAIQSVVIEAGR